MMAKIIFVVAIILTHNFLIGCASTRESGPAPIYQLTPDEGYKAIDPDTGERQPLMELPKDRWILVSIPDQTLCAMVGKRIHFCAAASTGKLGYATTAGEFVVGQKDIDHVSSKYPAPNGGAPMPYALQLSPEVGVWSAEWIHAGDVTEEFASHGCVRVAPDAAPRLFDFANTGTRVAVTQLSIGLHLRFIEPI